jgi:hypothetical protein
VLTCITLAEGVGFEPTEAFTSHAFEACPFGRSGTLPGRQVSGRDHSRHLPSREPASLLLTDGEILKISYEAAEEVSVHADLFANEGDFTPRPAWQVIEAARRQVLTGELSLATTPATRIFLRDGQVYFAERSTDGGLGVRLLVEGVITRQQMGKGALLVSGVEHLGRMFQRDNSIDRQSVELCVELMTDDVLTAVANDVIDHYTMTMYKRHPNGIDRWLPNRVEVITHIVAGSYLAEPEAVIAPGDGPLRHTTPASAPVVAPVVAPARVAEPAIIETETETEPETEFELVSVETVPAEPDVEEITAEEPEAEPETFVPALIFQPLVAEVPQESSPQDLEFAVLTVEAPASAGPRYSMNSWEPITAEMLLTSPPRPPVESPDTTADTAYDTAADTSYDTSHDTAVDMPSAPPMTNDSGIHLAQSAMDAIMSTAIADEVADAVRRALAAIDAAAQPTLELGTAPSNA